jgi:hypothetical protein
MRVQYGNVRRVQYPWLKSRPEYPIAVEKMSGVGMLTFSKSKARATPAAGAT